MACIVLISATLTAQAAAKEPMRFTAADQTVVRVYFEQKPVIWTGVPLSLAGAFGCGKPLPKGIHLNALPRDLLMRLPARAGFKYGRVGADVALIDEASGVVVDIIPDVFSPAV